jgi:hypothetical protein
MYAELQYMHTIKGHINDLIKPAAGGILSAT